MNTASAEETGAADSVDSSNGADLLARLAAEPHAFDFFQAVRRLESLRAERPRVGTARRPEQEVVHFGQEPSLTFAPATLAAYEPTSSEDEDAVADRLRVRFFGLFGPNGPLPLHLTEYVRSRIDHHDDTATAHFLDIFHHRMLSLFYRAWSASRQTVSYDRPMEDRFGDYVASLFGMGMKALRGRDALTDQAKLQYAGHMGCHTSHADGLVRIIEGYFGVDVELDEFVGQWLSLPADSRCRLGQSPETGTLGETAIVGSTIWECQQKFRVRLGPMDYEQYRRFLPDHHSFDRLNDWIRNYVGDAYTWETQLVLKREAVPKMQLGRTGQLGWTTWLGSNALERDPDNLVLSSPAA